MEEQLESGRDVVLEIEVQGALKVKEKFPEALLLFLLPPSAQELKHRLEKRGTETAEVIEQRLKRAREEAEYIGRYDFIEVNDDLDACMGRINGIVAAEEAEYIGRYDFIEVNDDLDACMGRINGIVAAAHGWPSLNTETINTLKEELDALAKGEN